MSNKELYKRTFSRCHPSHSPGWEEMETMKTRRRGHSWAGRLATAATVCATVAVLCGMAFMVNFLGVRDVLAPQARAVDIFDPETGAAFPGWEDTLSLAGYMSSPEGKALAEWRQDFLAGYDTDHAILDQVGNYLDPALEKYICYNVYTQDMADRLEEIAAEYGLKLHTQSIDLSAHPEALGSLADFAKDTSETYWMYMYEDGSCRFDGYAYVEDYGLVDVQFQRSVKGYFNDVILNAGNGEDYEQWSYGTSSGVPVMLALGPGRSLIFADLPDCFAVFNVLIGTDGGMTRERLEAVAERYDFGKLSPVEPPEVLPEPEPDPVVPAGERTDAREAYAKALRDLLYNGVMPGGGSIDMDWGDLSQDQFAVYDVDFDGREELILLHTASYMAGMNGLVMEFDPTYTGTGNPFYFQIGDWPAFTFYENGMVQVNWSHNQTHGELWPYELYGYDADGDYYYRIASVYSADKDIMEQAGIGEEYPDEVDKSGTGRVYYVNFLFDSEAGPAGERVWDSEEYFAWRDSLLGRAQEIDVPYRDLTEENIAEVLGGVAPVQTVPPEGMPKG